VTLAYFPYKVLTFWFQNQDDFERTKHVLFYRFRDLLGSVCQRKSFNRKQQLFWWKIIGFNAGLSVFLKRERLVCAQ
jgi:hypothetical protein